MTINHFVRKRKDKYWYPGKDLVHWFIQYDLFVQILMNAVERSMSVSTIAIILREALFAHVTQGFSSMKMQAAVQVCILMLVQWNLP